MPRTKSSTAEPSRAAIRKQNLAALAEGYTDDSYIHDKVRQGLALDAEKVALFERIATNRRQIRDFVTAGDMAKDDADMLYPPKNAKDENGENGGE